MRDEDRIRIGHMVEAAEDALRFVANRNRSDLDTDRMLLFALVRAVEIIGEAATKVTDETRNAHPSIPWKSIIGGTRGREALDRLRNVVGRVESSWRPASAEEGFEIVRRRLFQPMTDPEKFKQRDVVARAFADFYRANQAEFPAETRDADYEQRIKAAYPIHPEVFDRLYTD